MGEVGLEPTRPYGQQILSLSRLPVPPLTHITLVLTDAPFCIMQSLQKQDIHLLLYRLFPKTL